MKIVINKCYGGFVLSRSATALLAKLQGRKVYFFKTDYKDDGESFVALKNPFKEPEDLFGSAFDIPNPNKFIPKKKKWLEMTDAEKKSVNELYGKHSICFRDIERRDPLLIRVVEKLGKKADGRGSKLKIVNIPDGVDYEISDYDGVEHIAEKHRTWD